MEAIKINEVKVFVIVLDGAPFDVFHALTKKRILPNLKGLMKKGCFSPLFSTIPPISPVAMTSLATGKYSSKHGMFGFGHLVNGTFIPYTSNDIRAKALWDILTAAGKTVVVLNFPYTYPPFAVNGIMVSGFPSPHKVVQSHPPKLLEHLKSEIGEYYMDLPSLAPVHYSGMDEKRFLDEVYLVTKKREEAMRYLAVNYDWDLFIAAFTSLDRIQHFLFGFFDKESPFFNKQKRELLIQYYREIDAIIGRTLSLLDENTILMIASDHGFEPLYKHVGINNLLVQGGFAKKASKGRIVTLHSVVRFLEKHGLTRHILQILPDKLVRKTRQILPKQLDHANSKAQGTPEGEILINKLALQKDGATYETFRKRVINFLHSVTDTETGETIVEKVYSQNEIYANTPYDAPDLTVVFKKGYCPRLWVDGTITFNLNMRQNRNPTRTVGTGTHIGHLAQKGLFIVSGNGITKGLRSEAKIVDVAPTILHVLGVPVPVDLDGRVLKEVFEPQSGFAKRSVKYQSFTPEKTERRELLKTEKEEIVDRLKSLGYV